MNPAVALLLALAMLVALALAVTETLRRFFKRMALLDRRIFGDVPHLPEVSSPFHDAPYSIGGQDHHA